MAWNLRAALSALRNAPAEEKASAAPMFGNHFGSASPVWGGLDYRAFATDGYSKNVVVYRCVEEIAKGVATVPLIVGRKVGGEFVPFPDHPLQALLNRPNPTQSRHWLLYYMTGYMMLSGNTYLEGVRGSRDGSPIKELYVKRPDRMSVQTNRFGVASYTWGRNTPDETVWDVDPVTQVSDINHMRLFSPLDDVYGMSPVQAAALNIDQHNESDSWLMSQMQYGRPGALMSEQAMTDPQVERVQSQWAVKRDAIRKRGDILVGDGGLKWHDIGLTPKDLMLLDSKKLTGRFICMAFGVPAPIVGFDDATFNNQETARMAFWDTTVIPHLEWTLEELGTWFGQMFEDDDLVIMPDLDAVTALEPRRAAKWDRLQKADFLTKNEKREELGYEPIEGGDKLGVPPPVGGHGDEDGDDDKPKKPKKPKKPPKDDDEDDDEKSIAYKLFDDRGSDARSRELLIQNRLMDEAEANLERLLSNEMRRVARDAAVEYDHTPVNEVLLPVYRRHEDTIVDILTDHYRTTIELFGGRIVTALQKSRPADLERKEISDIFQSQMMKFITTVGLMRAKQLSDTTKLSILGVLEAGATGGFGADKIGRNILAAVGGDVGKVRAHTIARTETHTAAVYGGEAAVAATGLDDLSKEWIAAEDARTRPSHRSADGQIRLQGEKFDVGTAKMSYPGDPNGPASEVINCRCVVGYLSPDEIA
jgi:HK97 family phage portal protein